jgi:NAD-dependent dihydropyrimidine dehydrogenase PreA subunit
MRVDLEKCTGCGECVLACPLGVVRIQRRKAVVGEGCSLCGACKRVCVQEAMDFPHEVPEGAVRCEACPVGCRILEGFWGACQRYRNQAGVLVRMVPLHSFEDVARVVGEDTAQEISRPLVTGIGAGTTYPDCRPAPHILHGKVQGVDVVTVVTEAPLSYSSVLVKLDTDLPIGEEGAKIRVGRKTVGHLTTEQYGSKMLAIGGVNLLTGPDGIVVARTICDIANRRPVSLRVEGGARLELQVGLPPVVDGAAASRMRVGCGSATMGLFAPLLRQVADEVIVLDSHLTSLMSEHAAGRFVGVRPTGVRLRFRQSTPGRYFGDHGAGWGGTSIVEPRQVIQEVDMTVAWPGMRILVTETTGERAAMFRVGSKGNLQEMELTQEAKEAVEAIAVSCEPSRVSALYMGGAGGSARAGVTRYPLKLTQAVHARKAQLTVGGAPAFVLPGGGISFMVDVERVKQGAFYWTPTPATICPIEYTMRLQDYQEMGGHLEAMKPVQKSEE